MTNSLARGCDANQDPLQANPPVKDGDGERLPTNNLAEQAIRFVVIDRQITQGPRGEGGRRWLERIWTTMATCVQQGRSAFEFLFEAIRQHLQGGTAPLLFLNTS